MRNAGPSGVSAEGLCIKVGSTLSLIPGFVFSCGGLLSSFFCAGYSLVVAGCNFLIVAKDSNLVALFMGFSSCGGGMSLFVVMGSSLFVSGDTYHFAVVARGSSKRRQRILSR